MKLSNFPEGQKTLKSSSDPRQDPREDFEKAKREFDE